MKHFLWKIVLGCIAVKKNLQERGMQGDIFCARCGEREESINHVFFECPPRYKFGHSQTSHRIQLFSLIHHFSRIWIICFGELFHQMEDHQFAWILWYIWKGRNNKVFSNIDIDPRDTLKLVEMEFLLWTEAHVSLAQRVSQNIEVEATNLPIILGIWCFTDESWKDEKIFSGQGWYITLEGFDGLIGARNIRASLSPLHAEVEALIWTMECIRNLGQF